MIFYWFQRSKNVPDRSVRENKNGPDKIFFVSVKKEFPARGNKNSPDRVCPEELRLSKKMIELHQSKFISFKSGFLTQPFKAVFKYYQSRGLASELERQQTHKAKGHQYQQWQLSLL